MAIDFRMNYAEMEAHINALKKSVEEHRKIMGELNKVKDDLQKKSFVGNTGNAVAAYIDETNKKIDAFINHSNFLIDGLTKTVADVRGPLEDGMEGRFKK